MPTDTVVNRRNLLRVDLSANPLPAQAFLRGDEVSSPLALLDFSATGLRYLSFFEAPQDNAFFDICFSFDKYSFEELGSIIWSKHHQVTLAGTDFTLFECGFSLANQGIRQVQQRVVFSHHLERLNKTKELTSRFLANKPLFDSRLLLAWSHLFLQQQK